MPRGWLHVENIGVMTKVKQRSKWGKGLNAVGIYGSGYTGI